MVMGSGSNFYFTGFQTPANSIRVKCANNWSISHSISKDIYNKKVSFTLQSRDDFKENNFLYLLMLVKVSVIFMF